MKISSKNLTFSLYVLIMISSYILFSSYNKTSNEFLDNLFYLFYFYIGLNCFIGIVIKKPYKIIFFLLVILLICVLAGYYIFYMYMNGLAGAFKN